jgi:D-amino-acid oxidase
MGKKVLVIGAGVSGLTTAIALADAGYSPTIWTKELTADTTSSKAGGFWEPYRCNPIDKALGWSKVTFERLENELVNDLETGVRRTWMEAYSREYFKEPWWRPAVKIFKPLEATELPSGYKSGYGFETFVMDTSVYLPWLLKQAETRSIDIVQRSVESFDEVFAAGYYLVVNCSGLGSRELCNDTKVYPVRGQVVVVKSNGLDKIVLDGREDGVALVIPRTNDIVLGTTTQENDWNKEVDPADTAGILERVAKLEPKLSNPEVINEKVGLRPAREEVRLEAEHLDKGSVIHNYGHGGAGFTLSWGCAQEVVELAKAVN